MRDHIARKIEVEQRQGLAVVKIDGQVFPWALALDGVLVNPGANQGAMPTVTLVLLADEVEVHAGSPV